MVVHLWFLSVVLQGKKSRASLVGASLIGVCLKRKFVSLCILVLINTNFEYGKKKQHLSFTELKSEVSWAKITKKSGNKKVLTTKEDTEGIEKPQSTVMKQGTMSKSPWARLCQPEVIEEKAERAEWEADHQRKSSWRSLRLQEGEEGGEGGAEMFKLTEYIKSGRPPQGPAEAEAGTRGQNSKAQREYR